MMGVSKTCQVWPRSGEWKTRATLPPVANHMFRISDFPQIATQVFAGRECAFAFHGGGKLRGGNGTPGLTVVGKEQFEFELGRRSRDRRDGVAENDAVFRIPEDHGVEEAFGIFVGELQLPVLAGVGGVVDARLLAGAGGHEESFVGGEGDDGAEVERCGVGDLRGSPGASGIGGAEIGSVGAAGPGDFAGDRAHAAQAFGGVRELDSRAGLREGGDGDEEDEEEARMRRL